MKPVLRLKDVIIRQGQSFSLSIERLELLPNRSYALTGDNGAGKSTLLRALAFLSVPQRGTISFAATAETLTQRRQKVTLVEQSPYLLKGTVADNLTFGLKLRGIPGKEQKIRIKSTLETVGLNGFEQRKADKLSGGEVQRVALARALALQPEVLLLDEPTANIDSASLPAFEELLSRLPNYGVTLIFTTHDLTQPERLGSETIRLENGRLIASPKNPMKQIELTTMEQHRWLNPLKVQGL